MAQLTNNQLLERYMILSSKAGALSNNERNLLKALDAELQGRGL